MKLPEVAKRMREIGELIQENHPKESAELFELADEIKPAPVRVLQRPVPK